AVLRTDGLRRRRQLRIAIRQSRERFGPARQPGRPRRRRSAATPPASEAPGTKAAAATAAGGRQAALEPLEDRAPDRRGPRRIDSRRENRLDAIELSLASDRRREHLHGLALDLAVARGHQPRKDLLLERVQTADDGIDRDRVAA